AETLDDLFANLSTNGAGILTGTLADHGGPVQTIAIKQGGAAHDAGDNAAAVYDHDGDPATAAVPIPTDARGLARVSGASVDIGAMAIQATPANLVVTTLADEAYGGGDLAAEMADGGGLSLREALALANALGDHNSITFDDSLANGTLTLTG